MAFIGFKVPESTARVLSELPVPGKAEDAGHYHITLINLGDAVSIATLAKVMEVAYEVLRNFKPFTVRTRSVISFPKNDKLHPIVCEIEGPEIQSLWKKMCRALDDLGIDYSKKFPNYRPHVTLSYSEKAHQGSIHPLEWGCHEVVIWGGDKGSQRLVVQLPISIANRVAQRYKAACKAQLAADLP